LEKSKNNTLEEGRDNTFVFMPYQAMGDLFDKSVMCNEGIGDDEQLPYYKIKHLS
jgi:hypothetical protein